MRLLPLLSTGALAVSVPQPCLSSNAAALAQRANCPDQAYLTSCLQSLPRAAEIDEVSDCLLAAGCADAHQQADILAKECALLFPTNADLRRKRAAVDEPAVTFAPRDADAAYLAGTSVPTLFPRSAMSGEDCFTVKDTKTKECQTVTNGGVETETDCSTITTTTSVCAADKTCSLDKSGDTVCMDLKNSLDAAGIVIAIVFGVLAISGVGTLTFLCCKDRKEQKRLLAKAEATALVRAATKKKKADEAREQRAPLMAQQRARDASTGSTDPFADRNRS
ncbi:uncharacterized protein F5Z01DRAFT_108086 [Emericellopsis atlantica]|uniref:Extracellular membrane protein CFEM domain-containing protein n=1 Tax=Emericellopsis atlantica TaxID=2614577 RepID=A0A9P8CPU6_9HYPO|nr:uncharacterized protein F5Z01DRAFT_108086 [Emericellopsis atlantica]KAG9254490.1 hypothetical protein F5Z01DRAFT_108086 [Emericellopsis atlantica]